MHILHHGHGVVAGIYSRATFADPFLSLHIAFSADILSFLTVSADTGIYTVARLLFSSTLLLRACITIILAYDTTFTTVYAGSPYREP